MLIAFYLILCNTINAARSFALSAAATRLHVHLEVIGPIGSIQILLSVSCQPHVCVLQTVTIDIGSIQNAGNLYTYIMRL